MKTKMKRILALVMSIMMITSSMPVGALAETTTQSNYAMSTFSTDEPEVQTLPDTIQLNVNEPKYFTFAAPQGDNALKPADFDVEGYLDVEVVSEDTFADILVWGNALKEYTVKLTATAVPANNLQVGGNIYVNNDTSWKNLQIIISGESTGNGEGDVTQPEDDVTQPEGETDYSAYELLNSNKEYQLAVGGTGLKLYYVGERGPSTVLNDYGKDWLEAVDVKEVAGEGNNKTFYFTLKAKAVYPHGVLSVGFANTAHKFKILEAPAVTYTVTIDPNNAINENATAAITEGADIDMSQYTFEAPAGQEFDAWKIGEQTYPADAKITITGETTITATWKVLPPAVQVVFDNLKDNTVAAEDTFAGRNITLPSGLNDTTGATKFVGWSKENEGDLGKTETVSSYYNGEYTVNESHTLYAVWQLLPADVNVTFDLNDGEGTVNGITVKEGSSFNLPAATGLKKENRVLVGWSINAMEDLAKEATVPSSVMAPGASYTMGYDEEAVNAFHAVWQVEPEKEFIQSIESEYNLNQGQSITLYFYNKVNNNNQFQYQGDWQYQNLVAFNEQQEQTSDLDGYVLKKVTFTAPQDQTGTAMFKNYGECRLKNGSQGQLTVTINVISSTGTVTFNGNNGTTETKSAYAPNFTMPVDGFTAPEGKVLYGWSSAADTDYLDGTYDAPGYNVTGKDGDQTYYAVWGPEVKITFNANGGEGAVTGNQAKANTKYILPGKDGLTAPAGKCFYGWSENSQTQYTDINNIAFPGTEITLRQDIEYFAVWGPQVTLKYDLNGADGTVPEGKMDDPGFKINVAGTEGIVAPDKKIFAGWATEANGAVKYQPGAEVTVNQDTTLYAVWADAAKAIYRDHNDNIINDTVVVAVGQEVTLPNAADFVGMNPPAENPDYVFYGWSTTDQTPNTEAETGYYRPGQKVALPADTFFDAVWGPAKLQITVNVNHHYINGDNKSLYETETIILKANDPAFVVSKKDYPANVMVYRADETIGVAGVEGAQIDQTNGTVTFDTTKVALNDLNGTVDVDFYYDAYYTVAHRLDLPYQGTTVKQTGVTAYFPYGDRLINIDGDNVTIVEDVVANYWDATNKYTTLASVGAPDESKSAYNKNISKSEYVDYGSEEVKVFDSSKQPLPGATIYYYHLPYVDGSIPPFRANFWYEYLNIKNDEKTYPNTWENLTMGSITDEYAYYGEQLTFNFPLIPNSYFPAGHSELNPIGYFKDSPFRMWKYYHVPSNGDKLHQQKTVPEIEGNGTFVDMNVPLVLLGGGSVLDSKNTYFYRLYYFNKPASLTVSYYIDGKQIGETEIYQAAHGKTPVMTKPLPTYEVDGENVIKYKDNQENWFVELYNPLDYSLSYYSDVYGVDLRDPAAKDYQVTGIPGDGFLMPDRHIQFHAYTDSEKVNASVIKNWKDDHNSNGTRPYELEVQLTNSGITRLLTEENGWSATVTGLAKNKGVIPNFKWENSQWVAEEAATASFEPIEYKWFEVKKPSGYVQTGNITTVDGDGNVTTTLTNTLKQEKIDITVTKVWDDDDNTTGFRPESVQVALYANGELVGAVVPLQEKNNWSFTWKKMNQTDSEGKFINYTLEELYEDENYSSEVTGNAIDGFVVTNTLLAVETVEVAVTKVWNDADNQDGKRPTSITYVLKANSEVKDTQVVTGGDWGYTWNDLVKKAEGIDIVYTVEEQLAQEDLQKGYTASVEQIDAYTFKATNSYTPETITISVLKSWNDADNQDGIRPDDVTVQLLADGAVVKEETLTAEKHWTVEWTDLPKFANGTSISYTLKEVAVEGYTTQITYVDADNGLRRDYTVANTHNPETTKATVTKVWKDADNQDGVRPTSLKVKLSNNTEIELTAEKNWTATVEGLPKYAGGELIEYTWTEEKLPEGYSLTSNVTNGENTVITNSYTPGETSFQVTKIWNDGNNQDGKRPTKITVQLYAGDKAYGDAVELPNNGSWSYIWEHLPAKDAGQTIEYTVDETSALPEGYTKTVIGGNITNSYTPETVDVTAQKVWDDNNNQDGKRTNVTLDLYQKVGADGAESFMDGKSQTIALTDDLIVEWEDLPKYRGGVEIFYSVKEHTVPEGYEVSYSVNENGVLVVTNKHVPLITEASVKKVWDDATNQDGKRPTSLKVTLSNGTVVTLNEANNWTAKVENLPKYADGEEITYTWTEETLPEGYTNAGSVTEGTLTTITNKHVPEKTGATVKKVWDDADNQDGKRPTSLKVTLSNGTVVTLNAANNWTAKVENLPKYADGEEIVYTWTEDTLPEGYTYVGSVTEGTLTTITNKHVPEKTEASVKKVWLDEDNQDGKRPTELKVTLNDAANTVVTLNAANNWTAMVENLPKYADGEEIVYTWTEETLQNGYEFVSSTKAGTVTTITNKRDVDTTSVTVTKQWNDGENRDRIRPENVTVQLLAGGENYGAPVTLSGESWSYTWNGLPVNENRQEIKYSVVETSVHQGYTAEVTGNADAGFVVTNTHTPDKTAISGTKIWADDNDREGLRPESITLTLYKQVGTAEKTVEATKSFSGNGNTWAWSFDDLFMYEAGVEIVYSVDEVNVPAGLPRALKATSSPTPTTSRP